MRFRRRYIRALPLAFLIVAAFLAGGKAATAADDWNARGPERAVTALPGVGAGWLDTLRRVAGPAQIDTVSDLEDYDVGRRDLIGMFESWHGLISARATMIAYTRYARHWNGDICGTMNYVHPVEITGNPAGNLAHEFGHLFQFRARPHVVPEPGDSLPKWARDNIDERYADRFARAMLAIRGWADPSPYPDDVVLYHHLRYLLIRSYWPKDAAIDLVAQSRLDSAGTSVRRPSGPAPSDGTVVHPKP